MLYGIFFCSRGSTDVFVEAVAVDDQAYIPSFLSRLPRETKLPCSEHTFTTIPTMSRKHFFPNPEGVVVHMLQSLCSRNLHMALDEPNRVVYNLSHPPSQVTIISGGGSGHEPAWSGFVGDGMLSAAVCGDIFASPSTKQIMAGIRNVPSNEGVILCITNYTGDMLHFGLAREKGQALGYKVDVVCMAEDAALGREKSGKVGRRGLAGNLLGEQI